MERLIVRKIQVFHVDAFTDKPFGGKLGVVPNADGLTDSEMQNIAREINLSETVFISPSQMEGADAKVRYFTPNSEIDFCGHATIGLSWILATEYGWISKSEEIRLETNIGIIPVKWSLEEGKLKFVTMTQVAPKVRKLDLEIKRLSQLIGVAVDQIDEQYPIKLAYTGNWHLLVPVKQEKLLI
jgi:trans-2,3-dihydro-3-hydroxyanthranilate isomerase